MNDQVRARLERRGETLKRFLRRARLVLVAMAVIFACVAIAVHTLAARIALGIVALLSLVAAHYANRMLRIVITEVPGIINGNAVSRYGSEPRRSRRSSEK